MLFAFISPRPNIHYDIKANVYALLNMVICHDRRAQFSGLCMKHAKFLYMHKNLLDHKNGHNPSAEVVHERWEGGRFFTQELVGHWGFENVL